MGSPWVDQISKSAVDVLAQHVIVNSHYRSRWYWSGVGWANDIALLKLERPLKYNKYVWPICLPGLDYALKDHAFCTVTGWGLPRVDGKSEPPHSRVGGVGEDLGAGQGLPWADISETPPPGTPSPPPSGSHL